MSGAPGRVGPRPWWDRYFVAPDTTAARWTGDLLLAGVGLSDCWSTLAAGPWWQQVSVLVATGALWLRRRRPVAAFALTGPALFGAQAITLSCLALCARACTGHQRPGRSQDRSPHTPATGAAASAGSAAVPCVRR